MKKIIFLCTFLLSCANIKNNDLIQAEGIRERIYRENSDLITVELHYPNTGNSNLDDLIKARVNAAYNHFMGEFEEWRLDYLNEGRRFIYKTTFDVSRSRALKLISFVLYYSWEEQQADNRKLEIETVIFSLKYNRQVTILDFIESPVLLYEALIRFCRRQLGTNSSQEEYNLDMLIADREHLSFLAVYDTGIQVSFTPGTLMDKKKGAVQFLVPWEEAMTVEPWQKGIASPYRPQIPF